MRAPVSQRPISLRARSRRVHKSHYSALVAAWVAGCPFWPSGLASWLCPLLFLKLRLFPGLLQCSLIVLSLLACWSDSNSLSAAPYCTARAKSSRIGVTCPECLQNELLSGDPKRFSRI